MSNLPPIEQERQELAALKGQSLGKKLGYYTKKSGPGWLQSAITLGGGSLGSAMFLGVLGGFSLMWVQPLGMILGIVMLSAIAYVTLSTGRRPFGAINQHISPVLGWAWLIATMLANIVWTMPQFSLANDVVLENLAPGLKGDDGGASVIWITNGGLFALAFIVIWFYNSGNKGIKIFEVFLKTIVGMVVLCFFAVAIALAGKLPWGEVFKGFIPNFGALAKPTPAYEAIISQTGEFADFWRNSIGGDKRNTLLAAFATAVGINMTFLLPYSMLRKGWGKEHRGLSRFDLCTGLLIPFVLATGCLVLAAANQLHAQLPGGELPTTIKGSYAKNLEARYAFGIQDDETAKETWAKAVEEKGDAYLAALNGLPEADKKLAAMKVKPNTKGMSTALAPLVGDTMATYIFGIGVLGMAISTIIILMLINGFVFTEMFNKPDSKMLFRLGAIVSGILGVLYPIFWTNPEAKAWFVVPASVFGLALLPIAYFTFTLMMNSKSLLGDQMPTGLRRIIWNALLFLATGIATYGAIWGLLGKGGNFLGLPIKWLGIGLLSALIIGGLLTFRGGRGKADATPPAA